MTAVRLFVGLVHQEASDRATRYGILSKKLDVSKAVDRSFAASANSN